MIGGIPTLRRSSSKLKLQAWQETALEQLRQQGSSVFMEEEGTYVIFC
jgi:hypothetical protein